MPVNKPAQTFFRRYGFTDDPYSPSVADPSCDVDYDILSVTFPAPAAP